MRAIERIGLIGDRIFDRLRDRRAFALGEDGAVDGDLDSLRGHTYAVLVTFRPSGEPVPTPVWCAVDEAGKAYVKTARRAGKVRRLRGDSRVLVAPSNARGRPAGPAIRATARLLDPEECAHAERTLAAAYGAGRRTIERVLGGPEESAVYIEVVPRA